MTTRISLALALLSITACRGGEAGFYADDGLNQGQDGGGQLGVGQGGAQDFGLFKEILEAGGIPGPSTLDELGFFNEHVIEQPAPTCGQEVCINGRLGTMGNMISGSDCTVVVVGLNTSLDPDEMERPPLDLTLVVDTSGSMAGERILQTRLGLMATMAQLEPEDRITVVSFDTVAEVLAEWQEPGSPELIDAIMGLDADGSTNLYEGLRVGLDAAVDKYDPSRQSRVLVLSDGEPTAGFTSTERIAGLADAGWDVGISTTAIGVGEGFDAGLLQAMAEDGGGAYYFIADEADLTEVFTEELSAFLIPLAEQVRIDADVGEGWSLRGLYGTKTFEMDAASAHIEIDRLQIAHRTTPTEFEQGRRGGGGAMILELRRSGVSPARQAGSLDFEYVDPISGETRQQSVDVTLPEGSTTEWFADDQTEKAFVMLNLYVGFRIAARSAAAGSDNEALTVLHALRDNGAQWVIDHPDFDIEDDLVYVDLFIDNLEQRAGTWAPTSAPEPWPVD